MNAYEFCVSLVPQGKVLDYGCGAGQIVSILRSRGIDASGCDVFYEGGDYSPHLLPDAAKHIHRMTGDRIPFANATFDVVISNQVMEHVPNFDIAMAEIARVLKPGGRCIHVFPDRGVWREGHCAIPFLHRFPKGSRARVYYAAALYRLGIGTPRTPATPITWAQGICDWLDKWTYYRSREEIHTTLSKHFGKVEHAEEKWFNARLGDRPCPRFLKRFIVRKLAGMVLIAHQTTCS